LKYYVILSVCSIFILHLERVFVWFSLVLRKPYEVHFNVGTIALIIITDTDFVSCKKTYILRIFQLMLYFKYRGKLMKRMDHGFSVSQRK
jgi:hypothetical protein